MQCEHKDTESAAAARNQSDVRKCQMESKDQLNIQEKRDALAYCGKTHVTLIFRFL